MCRVPVAWRAWITAVAVVSGATTSWALTVEQEAKLLPADGANDEEFGWSVALEGDTAIIGRILDEEGFGAAYVFSRVGDVWTEQAKLVAGAYNWFGSGVALDGGTAIIGAAGDDDNGRGSRERFPSR